MRNGLSKDLIERILDGAPKYTIAQLEEKYPKRNLPENAMVTRVAPSPTGFMHLGTLYQMLIAKKLAVQSGGVFYIRIEDTDTKREVEGSVDLILKCSREFNLLPDEGPEQGGLYGPYTQSQRWDVYHSVVAQLLADGRAYPCFLRPKDMDEIRENQTKAGFATGIYGEFARDRNLSPEEIEKKLDNGEIPSVRLYSTGDRNKKIFFNDKTRGRLELPENDEDIVLIKSNDKLPTYHFAHLCDDRFMRTTLVQRGEEWMSSLNLHLQLFKMMEWQSPDYIHVATINKLDNETNNSRKLSKRKDIEADAMQYLQKGYPTNAVLEYLFNIVASGYEEAKIKGQVKTIWEHDLRIKRMPTSSALFDMVKLQWWAREYIAGMSIDDLFNDIINWIKEYSPEWENRISGSLDYLKSMLYIERENPKRIRKDFITWEQTLEELSFFWDDLYVKNTEFEFNKSVLDAFIAGFDINDTQEIWWNKIVQIAVSSGLKNGDVAMQLRVALTGRQNAPDLYSVIGVMGDKRIRQRISSIAI